MLLHDTLAYGIKAGAHHLGTNKGGGEGCCCWSPLSIVCSIGERGRRSNGENGAHHVPMEEDAGQPVRDKYRTDLNDLTLMI